MNLIYQTKPTATKDLKINGLYFVHEYVYAHYTLKDLIKCNEHFRNGYTMLQVIPPILLKNEEFIVLDIIDYKSDQKIIKFLTTTEILGYFEYSNNIEIFYDSIKLYENQNVP